jgi:hypothetical protein
VTVLWLFLVFYNHENFDKYWSVILYDVLNLGFKFFIMISLSLCMFFSKNGIEVLLCVILSAS